MATLLRLQPMSERKLIIIHFTNLRSLEIKIFDIKHNDTVRRNSTKKFNSNVAISVFCIHKSSYHFSLLTRIVCNWPKRHVNGSPFCLKKKISLQQNTRNSHLQVHEEKHERRRKKKKTHFILHTH